MSTSFAAWSLILFALIVANIPFINQRLFALFKITSKPFWLRLLELVVGYFLIGVVAYLFEAHIGNVFSQGWEFYAITICLFIVFAFPGFVYQYLRR